MRSAFLALTVTVVACMILLTACFNKGSSSGPGFAGGLPDVLAPGYNFPDAGTARYTVGGQVLGLVGTGLVLEGDGIEDVSVAPPASGGGNVSFRFGTAVPAGFKYSIVVKTQPTNPSQNCTVANGTAAVPRGNVTNILVNCAADSFLIGGTATGVEGSGLVLMDNGGDPLAVTNGTFVFMKPVASGSKYAVTVASSPTFPSENCTVTQGAGTVGAKGVTTVAVNCIPNVFNVGGTVVGLVGTGLVLTDNGTDNVKISASGAFVFPSPVTSGSPFTATISSQPSNPVQTCSIAGAAGTVGDGDISSVVVNCSANAFTVSGTVGGLAGGGLVLNTSAGLVNISSNGGFALPAALANGASYSVSIAINPTNPTQACSVTGGSGVIVNANVVGIVVQCTTGTFTIGGQVSGLNSGAMLTLTDNGGDSLVVAGNGGFPFATPLASGAPYVVAVPPPPGQNCSVSSSGSGIVSNANVVNINVQCSGSDAGTPGDFCADPLTDQNNCGSCGLVCPAVAECQGGSCKCPNGALSLCGSACVNEQTDSNNCGGCGIDSPVNQCGPGQTCQNGSCLCTSGHFCSVNGGNGICVDFTTDPANCGGCGNLCANGFVCLPNGGGGPGLPGCGLSCPAGEIQCGPFPGNSVAEVAPVSAYCANLQTDSNNCGGCGNAFACPEGLNCQNGSCCPAGQMVCDSACVDVTTDSQNCGGCVSSGSGSDCTVADLTCQNGSCCTGALSFCPSSGAPTGGPPACVDETSDVNNCGGCGVVCVGNLAPPACNAGACVCNPGQTYCPGIGCVDETADANNCGACGNICLGQGFDAGGASCQNSACTCSAEGETYCPGKGCVDFTSDSNNCGGCGNPSTGAFQCLNGGNCGGGSCQCDAEGATYCPGTVANAGCVFEATDKNNCGGCNVGCPGSSTCQDSACGCDSESTTPTYCAGTGCVNETTDPTHCGGCTTACTAGTSPACCGGACTDESSDPANCNACGSACTAAPDNGAAACIGNACSFTCSGALTACPSVDPAACVDATSDNNNCGSCGNVCPAGLTCANSSCCPASQTLCNGVCVTEGTDPNHCGNCTVICSEGVCFNGSCCGNGQKQCNGMCVNIQSDATNCGDCGITCPAGVACQNSSCCSSPNLLCGPGSRNVSEDSNSVDP